MTENQTSTGSLKAAQTDVDQPIIEAETDDEQ
jgi:hypothetical protein